MPPHTKRCCTCGQSKPRAEFYRLKSTSDGRYPHCIACYRERRADKAEQIEKARKTWEAGLRAEAFKRYGGECVCCGEKTPEFLSIVATGRRKGALPRTNMTLWLRRNRYPRGFQILCGNCSLARKRCGYCPHYDEPSL